MNAPLVMLTIVSTLVAAATTAVAWRTSRESDRRRAARIAGLAEEIHGPGFTPAFPAVHLRAPAIPLASGVVLILTIIATLSWLTRANGPVAPSPRAAEPLQLIALTHTMTPDGLLVTGTIRNADTAARRQDLSVLILAFDRERQVVARVQQDAGSGSLEPGQSSTFALTVPSRGAPATFKVSFRQQDAVVPHVDRRPVERALVQAAR